MSEDVKSKLAEITKKWDHKSEASAKDYIVQAVSDETLYQEDEWENAHMTIDLKWLINALHKELKDRQNA